MKYTIINTLSKLARSNMDLIYDSMKKNGITNKFMQAGILAVVAKETGFMLRPEVSYENTRNDRIRTIFSKFNSYSDKELDKLKKSPKDFFDNIYGGLYGNSPKEGYKYRGRGFNGVTFKAIYQNLKPFAGVDIVKDPDLLNDPKIAAPVLIGYYLQNLTKAILIQWDIKTDINGASNLADAVGAAYHVTAGNGLRSTIVATAIRVGTWQKVNDYGVEFYEWILKKDGSAPDPNAFKKSDSTQNTGSTGVASDGSSGSSDGTNGSDSEGGTSEDGSTKTAATPYISNILEAQIKPKQIKFNTPPQKDYKKEIANSLGNIPFLWYNSYQIAPKDIEFLQLNTIGNLPNIKVTFRDPLNLMKDKGFPLDDTKISIFINPRSNDLKPIHMDFKITNFTINNKVYNVTGILDAGKLYVKKFKSIPDSSSFNALKEIAKEIGLGFSSNIDDTDDKMTWINPGQRTVDFIENIVDSSYKSDEAYMVSYIDYYYNLTYVELEKELNRNIREELGIPNSGLEDILSLPNKDNSSLFLTNDFAMQNSNNYFVEHKIINNSTSVSIKEGYLTKVKFYDQLKKDFLIFDVDSISSQGDKIILKGAPQDEQFYKENVNLVYNGKLDSDNAHKNYNYSFVQNQRNITDLQKIGLELTMKTPNYNIYRFQKIFVFISNQAPTPAASHMNNRLSGEWLIIDILYRFDGNQYNQIVKLVKRELELSGDELKEEGEQKATNKDGKENTSNDKEDSTDGSSKKEDSGDDLSKPKESVALPTSVDAPSNNLDSTITRAVNSKLVSKVGSYYYIVDSTYGIAGKRLINVIADLQAHLRKNGYPDATVIKNGITRDLKAAATATDPARASGSLHGAGLAIDVGFKGGPSKYTNSGWIGPNITLKNGKKVKWESIYDNVNLASDPDFVKTVWNWVQQQRDLVWGAEWGNSNPSKGNIKGDGIKEFHHFELKTAVIESYWKPYFKDLKDYGFDYTKLYNTKQLGELYTRLLKT